MAFKRKLTHTTPDWDEVVDGKKLRTFLSEAVDEVRKNYPVREGQDVTGNDSRVSKDVISLVLPIVVQASGYITEDTIWLLTNNICHISMGEL